MKALHDLHCTACSNTVENVLVEDCQYPDCELCGAAMDWTPAQLNTDVFGSEQYSEAAGRSFTSQRQKRNFMREAGYEEAGDKVGGARPEHRIKGTGFSYGGQSSRVSTGERK